MTEETKQEPQVEPEKPNFPFVPSEDGIFEIYSNLIDANWTLYDIRLRFAQIVPNPIGSETQWRADERAAVTFSWPQAKVLRDILIDLVKKFEETNGEIKPLKLPA